MASWFIRASWSWACCGLLQSQGTRSLTPRATRLGAPCPPLVSGGFHSLTGVTRLGDGQPQAAAGPRWAGWWGLENEGTDYEAGALMAQDFIFWRLFFASSSPKLPKFSDAPGPRACGPEMGWEKGAGIPFLDLQALSTQIAPSSSLLPRRDWLVFLQAQAALCGPHQPWVSLRQPPCMFIEGCLLSGREDGKGSIFMLGLFHVLLLPTASV